MSHITSSRRFSLKPWPTYLHYVSYKILIQSFVIQLGWKTQKKKKEILKLKCILHQQQICSCSWHFWVASCEVSVSWLWKCDFCREQFLTLFERDPHCETCLTLQKTPVFPVLQTWYNPAHHLPKEKTASKYNISDKLATITQWKIKQMMTFLKLARTVISSVCWADVTHTAQCGEWTIWDQGRHLDMNSYHCKCWKNEHQTLCIWKLFSLLCLSC